MRRQVASRLIACVAAFLMGSCAASEKPTVDSAAVKAAIEGLDQKFVADVAARDTAAVSSFFADDASVLPNNAPRADGHDAVRAVMAQFLRTPGLAMTLSSTEVTVSESGDLAIDVGAYQVTMTGPKGEPVRDVGKYVTIYRKVGQEWKISVTTSNSDAPMPR